MTLKFRIIPCLDVKDGRVINGINYVDLVDLAAHRPALHRTRTSHPASRCRTASSTVITTLQVSLESLSSELRRCLLAEVFRRVC